MRKLGWLLDWEVAERNANHIVPSYCHLPLSCRNLVDRCGYVESCKPQINFFSSPKFLHTAFNMKACVVLLEIRTSHGDVKTGSSLDALNRDKLTDILEERFRNELLTH